MARRIRNLLRGDSVILLYHRVTSLETDPQWLCVSPENFAAQMQAMENLKCVIPLADLAGAIARKKTPRGKVAITFDDGYADNLDAAKTLQRKHLPATFFLTTEFIGSDRELFWDELDRLLLARDQRPAGDLSESEVFDPRWNILSKTDPSKRYQLYRQTCDLLKPMNAAERADALMEIRGMVGAGPDGRTTHRALSWKQAIELAQIHCVDIGAHTQSHPMLSKLDEPAQRMEISGSVAQLSERLGARVRGLSYPFGGRADYNDTTLKVARDCGLAYACANWPAVAGNSADLFALPRFVVRDWNAEEFLRHLSAWRAA